jgi:hypothetical protein
MNNLQKRLCLKHARKETEAPLRCPPPQPKISDYGGSVSNVVISNFNQDLDQHKKGFIAQASDVGSGITTSFNVQNFFLRY